MTNWSNVTSFEGLLLEANRYSDFWTAMFFMIWIVLMITFVPFGISVSLIGGSFAALLIGLFLVYMGLMAWQWLLMIVGVIIGVAIWDAMFAKRE